MSENVPELLDVSELPAPSLTRYGRPTKGTRCVPVVPSPAMLSWLPLRYGPSSVRLTLQS